MSSINPKSNMIKAIAFSLNLNIDYNKGIPIYTDNSNIKNKKNIILIQTHNYQKDKIVNRICKRYNLIINYLKKYNL